MSALPSWNRYPGRFTLVFGAVMLLLFVIEHIMRAVMSFSQRLVVLVSGKKIADGKPDVVIRDPEVERAYLGQ